MPRAKYDSRAEATKLLEKLKDTNPDILQSTKLCMTECKKNGIKIASTSLGIVRNRILKGNATGNSAFAGDDLLKKIGIVSKAANRVGGLDQLQNVVSIIEKVRKL